MSSNLTISLSQKDNSNSKNSEIIRKKLQKIEKLKEQLSKLKKTLDTTRLLYKENCEAEDHNFWLNKEQLIILLFKRFQQKGFVKWQKDLLESKLSNELEQILFSDFHSEIAIEIRAQLDKIASNNMSEDEQKIANEMARSFLENMGIELDDDFNFEDLKNSDFKERISKIQEERIRNEQQESHQWEQEEKQNEQQKKVAKTNVDFHKLYKSLVKKAHPDLVTDLEEKEKREVWMKRLSAAWEERNYYELLVLQAEIIDDPDSKISISDTQVQPLIKELNKKISELESKKYELKCFDSETAFYFENFNARSEKGILKKILKHKEHIQKETEDIRDEINRMKTQKATKELLTEINESIGQFNPFDIFGTDTI